MGPVDLEHDVGWVEQVAHPRASLCGGFGPGSAARNHRAPWPAKVGSV